MASFKVDNLSFFYGAKPALQDITIDVVPHRITALIGPSGCGKSTFLRCLNRMNDTIRGTRVTGEVLLDGQDIYAPDMDLVALRKRVGMLFALPVALPVSIYENVVYGPRLSGIRAKARLDEIVERSLTAAFLWDEVRDRLRLPGLRLSGGQQQRLCLARVLAMEELEVILLDEPCSGLDPISTAKIEDALKSLKEKYTIILVTNNTKQAARVADDTAFFLMGELVEYGPTDKIFTVPDDKRTNDYVTGRFG